MTALDTLIDHAWMDISSWKQRFPDKKALGVFGPSVPWETILESGYEPVYLFPENLLPSRSGHLLPSFSCSVSRALLDYALTIEKDQLDALLLVQSCDAVRAVADIAAASGSSVPVHYFALPRKLANRSAKQFYQAELASLTKKLGGPAAADNNHGKKSVENIRKLVINLSRKRMSFSSFQFYSILRAVHFLPKNFVIRHLQKLLEGITPASSVTSPSERSHLFLAGSHLPGKLLLTSVDSVGAVISGDMTDLGPAALTASPFEGEMLPGFHRDTETRRALFRQNYHASGARGVLFYRRKFCDPHGFDIADLSGLCRTEEIPFLYLELDQQSDSERIHTRLEAFLEMLDR